MDIWDRTTERALFNIVPDVMQKSLLESSQSHPDLFGKDEQELFSILRLSNREPSATDNRLRIQFWFEYDRAQAAGSRMELKSVFNGVCSPQAFYQRVLMSPSRVAWMVCPVTSYITKISEALDYGTDRMREILAIDPNPPGQKPNVKLMELQAKIWAMLDVRKNGAPTQRIEQKNLSITMSEKQVQQALVDNSMDAIEKRLKELEKRDRELQNIPEPRREVIDVEPV